MSNIDKRADSVSRIIADLKLKHGSGDTYAPIMRWDELLALLDELEAKDKSIGFLKDHLAQLANFNPDWDRLEAATDSLREHMAKLSAAEKRIAELERGSKVIKCWPCQKSVTVDQVTAEDGFCPSCNCGIDLEDYEIAELLATGIITKVGGRDMAEFTKEQRDILIKTAEYMVKRENTSEYSENIRKVAEYSEPMPLYAAPQLPHPAVVDENGLLRCPFCGSAARIVDSRLGFYVQCCSDNCDGLAIGPRVPELQSGQEEKSIDWEALAQAAKDKWNRRAAMLQAGNHTEQYLDMVDHFVDASEKGKDGTLINEGTMPATQIKPVADLYGITSPTGSETTFTFDAGEASSFVGSGWTVQEYVELERYQEAITGK